MSTEYGPAIRPVALTMGEPAGIGPDITLKCWLRRNHLGLVPFFVIADPATLATRAAALGTEAPIKAIEDPAEAAKVFASALPVLPVECPRSVPGAASAETAPAVIASIEKAVALTRAGLAGAVVTNPIAKAVLAQAGFRYPGHTEFLAALAADGLPPPRPVMMIAGPELRVVPVTIHIALKTVADVLSVELIVETGRITATGLKRYFDLARPRLAIAGLNPHAGENGLFGDEEARIIVPAVARLRDEDIDAIGPLPPDTMFHAEARRHFDVALCMYHDQALIPAKTLAFDEAVNVTLGLPFVRTSPDHGTAFDLAATGRARETSLASALKLAASMSRHRDATDEARLG